MITIGEITGVHGIKGYVKIRSFADSPNIFTQGIRLFVDSPKKTDNITNDNLKYSNKSVNNQKSGVSYKIATATPHKKGIILLFEGVNRDIAETLVGKNISISKDDLPELEDDAYYWEDLIGIEVIDINLGSLGAIDHIIPTGSNDVFVVKTSNINKKSERSEILIPALSWVILSVDLNSRRMTVDLPEGLKD